LSRSAWQSATNSPRCRCVELDLPGRPGLGEALAACREGDALVVTKLDRLARTVPDARDIVDELTDRGIRLWSAQRRRLDP